MTHTHAGFSRCSTPFHAGASVNGTCYSYNDDLINIIYVDVLPEHIDNRPPVVTGASAMQAKDLRTGHLAHCNNELRPLGTGLLVEAIDVV